MILVPRTTAELYEHLAAMTVGGLHMLHPHFPDQSRESMFVELEEGLCHLKKKLGNSAHYRLLAAMSEAKSFYEAGDDTSGVHILQHMMEYIRLNKFKTDEPVVDAGRFQAH